MGPGHVRKCPVPAAFYSEDLDATWLAPLYADHVLVEGAANIVKILKDEGVLRVEAHRDDVLDILVG